MQRATVFSRTNRTSRHSELVRIVPKTEMNEDATALADTLSKVLEADGAIPGYRWGVVRKRQSLQLEQAA